jgi:16S rRNA (uracil1498-N3)-methyltransferase
MKKLHRFIGDFDLTQTYIRVSDPEIYFQMTHVLKFKTGEVFILSNGTKDEAVVVLEDIQKDHVMVRKQEVHENTSEPERHITLYASIIKADHFELLAQKCTEVGLFQIVPVISHRTIKLGLRETRIFKIMQEAAEQSGRARVPNLLEIMRFEEALEHAQKNEKNFFLDIGVSPHLQSFQNAAFQSAGIFIGPEGGFESREQKQALEAGCILTNLGPLVLRAETAAIIASYILSTKL